MQRIVLDTEAGQVSAELALLGIKSATRVRATVNVIEAEDIASPSTFNQAGGAFDWLEDEPDIYTDADLRSTEP